MRVLLTSFKSTILAECPGMIKDNETKSLSHFYFLNLSFFIYIINELTNNRFVFKELRLLFKLMDRVTDGVATMLRNLEDHIISAGLADMISAADIITQVNILLF